MSSYLTLADNLCCLLWDKGMYYTFGKDCSGRWCVFLYTKRSKEPKLVAKGFTDRQLCVFFARLYNEKA